jgi:hypothetical protein
MDPDRRRSVLPDASAQFRESRITWMGRLSGRVATLDDHSPKSGYVITRLGRLATRDGRDARDIADLHKDSAGMSVWFEDLPGGIECLELSEAAAP